MRIPRCSAQPCCSQVVAGMAIEFRLQVVGSDGEIFVRARKPPPIIKEYGADPMKTVADLV